MITYNPSTDCLTSSLANLQGTVTSTRYHEDDLYSILNNIPDEGKKENTMCYPKTASNTANATVVAVAADPTKDMRDHLARRLNQVYGKKTDELYHAFYDIDTPKTKEEFLARLKVGKFTVGDESFDKDGKLRTYHSLFDSFSWRLAPVDEQAYEAARDEARIEHTKANDIITVLSPEQGLEALRAFEAWQPTGLPN